jgi:hypothetical protein
MQQGPFPVSIERVRTESLMVAAFQGLDVRAIDGVLAELAPHLACYAELALTERGFEVLTGGRGATAAASLAAIARRHGAPDEVVDGFRACVAALPDRMLGLKLCFGPDAAGPTLYHRTMAPKAEVFALLAEMPPLEPALASLAEALAGSATIYGLAFVPVRGALGLKVYTIGDVRADLAGGIATGTAPGFVSHRVAGGRASVEVKRYLTEVSWDRMRATSERWAQLIDLARGPLGYQRAAYLGVLECEGEAPETKIYFERIGAIPTAYSAR